jgi:hypothetical protein
MVVYKNKKIPKVVFFVLMCAALWGGGRLYYQFTGGFLESNIHHEIPYDSRWDLPHLALEEHQEIESALNQKYSYLGKGCQSYVFLSEDGSHVVKFLKYQRFRPQEWLNWVSFLPYVDAYRLGKIEKKKNKLDNVFTSWKIAYEDLSAETGARYVHLNKSHQFSEPLVLIDKIGLRHEIDLNQTEFLLQRRAEMLCPTLDRLMAQGQTQEARQLLSDLLDLLISEYHRGFADNDHALMQNTGVLDKKPVHIDVGQFVYNEKVRSPEVWHQEIFNKTYKFRIWLHKHHGLLADSLELRLKEIIGPRFNEMKPYLRKGDVAGIPHVRP